MEFYRLLCVYLEDIFIFTFLVVSCCLHGSYVILHVIAAYLKVYNANATLISSSYADLIV